jgi:hypothetical protein
MSTSVKFKREETSVFYDKILFPVLNPITRYNNIKSVTEYIQLTNYYHPSIQFTNYNIYIYTEDYDLKLLLFPSQREKQLLSNVINFPPATAASPPV